MVTYQQGQYMMLLQVLILYHGILAHRVQTLRVYDKSEIKHTIAMKGIQINKILSWHNKSLYQTLLFGNQSKLIFISKFFQKKRDYRSVDFLTMFILLYLCFPALICYILQMKSVKYYRWFNSKCLRAILKFSKMWQSSQWESLPYPFDSLSFLFF